MILHGDRRGLLQALGLVLAMRVLVFGAGVLSLWMAPPEILRPETATGFPMVAWDSFYYREILTVGYPPPDGSLATLAFFPGYPIATRLISPPLGPEVALLLVANVTGVAGLLLAYVWARALVPPEVALAGTALLSAYPPAAFLSAAYTEGPFLMLVAITFLAMQREAWGGAAFAAGLATACRPTGVALSVITWLAAAAARLRAWRGLRSLVGLVVLGALTLTGVAAYEVYLWKRYDDPLVYFAIQRYWNAPAPPAAAPPAPSPGPADPITRAVEGVQALLSPWPAVERRVSSLSVWNKGWAALCLLVAMVGLAAPGPYPRLLFGLPPLIFLMVYLPNHGSPVVGVRMTSMARFTTAAIPCFFLVAWWLRRWRRALVLLVVIGVLLQLVYAAAISRGWWAG